MNKFTFEKLVIRALTILMVNSMHKGIFPPLVKDSVDKWFEDAADYMEKEVT